MTQPERSLYFASFYTRAPVFIDTDDFFVVCLPAITRKTMVARVLEMGHEIITGRK